MKAQIILVAIFGVVLPVHAAPIQTVLVGNPGNIADLRIMSDSTLGYGAVDYEFRMGRTEVTNSQYVEFLNSVDPTGANSLSLYQPNMHASAIGGITFLPAEPEGSRYKVKEGRANNPVVVVTWYDAIRFANWLHNGGTNASTEDGAYTLHGGTPIPSNASQITRNPGAKWFLPNEHEWHKSAYHKNDGVTGNYWDYPTASNLVPYSDQPPGNDAPDTSNTANYWNPYGKGASYNNGFAVTGSNFLLDAENYLSDGGAYTNAMSPYGTFDQAGNVWEWNESLIRGNRGIRGGSWGETQSNIHATCRCRTEPTSELLTIGFRVATSIPEPTSLVLGAIAGMGLLVRRSSLRETAAH